MISDYEKSFGRGRVNLLSKREREVLSDLYRGLSRPEIAEKQGLSGNTINSAVNSVFNKLGAHSVADAVRIAAEEKLV
ncbi:MAG TPA: helix-turn-helix transcriptional regulator [Coriobacteriia bacterium]|nr:helix-turn-helix transcriptional regulator [Coriobacteriia bacterium]